MSLSQLKAVSEQSPDAPDWDEQRFVEARDKLIRMQFQDAAMVAADRDSEEFKPVNLNTIGPKELPGMPRALRTEIHFDDSHRPDGEQQFTMEFLDGDDYFGAITARMNVVNGKIRLFDMQYDSRKIRGFAPYALRHLISVFRDVKHLSVATGVMGDLSKLDKVDAEERLKVIISEHAKLSNFERIDFPLIDARTNKRITLPKLEDVKKIEDLKPCRAILSFDDDAAVEAVSKKLELDTAAKPHRDVAVFAPVRHDKAANDAYAGIIAYQR